MFVQHSNICPANYFQFPGFANGGLQNPCNYFPSAATSSSNLLHQNASKHAANKKKCDYYGHTKHHSSIGKFKSKPQTNRKRKETEKENIDPELMAKLKSAEWENRTGYWCQRCNPKKRFGTSDELVYHMAKNVHSVACENGQSLKEKDF